MAGQEAAPEDVKYMPSVSDVVPGFSLGSSEDSSDDDDSDDSSSSKSDGDDDFMSDIMGESSSDDSSSSASSTNCVFQTGRRCTASGVTAMAAPSRSNLAA